MKTYCTMGLDQLGPKHGHAVDLYEHVRRGRNTCWSVSSRANSSTLKRKVKITLPSADTLRSLLED